MTHHAFNAFWTWCLVPDPVLPRHVMAFWGVARIGRQRIPSQLQNCSSRFYTSCKTSLIFKAYPGLEAQLEHFLVRVAGHPFYIKTLKATESRSRLYQWITLENISAINGPTLLSEKTQYPWKPQLWHPHPRIPVHMLRFYLWSRCPYSAQIYEQLMAQYTATSKQDLVTYLVQLVPWIALFAYLDGTGTPIQKTPQAAVTLNIWRSPSTLNPFISEADAELLDRQLTDLWATIRQETVAFSSLGSTSTSHPGAQDQNSVRLLQTDVCETSAQNRNVLMTSSCHDIPTDLRYSIVLDICGNDVNILAQYFCDQSKRSDPRRHVGRYFKQKASSAVKNENNNTFGNTTPPWSLINNTSFDIPEQAAHRPESSTNSSDSDEQQNILFCTERPGPAHTHFFDQRSAKEETALDQDRLTFCTNKQTKDHLLQINGENILQVFDQLPMTATSAVLYSIASALTEQLIPSSQTDAQTSTHSSRYIVRRPYYLGNVDVKKEKMLPGAYVNFQIKRFCRLRSSRNGYVDVFKNIYKPASFMGSFLRLRVSAAEMHRDAFWVPCPKTTEYSFYGALAFMRCFTAKHCGAAAMLPLGRHRRSSFTSNVNRRGF